MRTWRWPRNAWRGGMALLVALATTWAATRTAAAQTDTYSTRGTDITRNGTPWVFGGVNDFDQFGLSNKGNRDIKAVRTVVDVMQFCPIASSEGSMSTNIGVLQPLEDVVKNNRAQGKVTILAMFGWNDTDVTEMKGLFP